MRPKHWLIKQALPGATVIIVELSGEAGRRKWNGTPVPSEGTPVDASETKHWPLNYLCRRNERSRKQNYGGRLRE